MSFATLYGFGFIAVAEYLFWGEFSARFNFISVDYLVYRREVTNNITSRIRSRRSWLALLVAAGAIYWGCFRESTPRLRTDEPFRRRIATAMVVWLSAGLAYGFVDQELRDRFADNYVRELASDGPYQFVAAFRNNELDYAQFYQLADSAQAASLLKSQLNAATVPISSIRIRCRSFVASTATAVRNGA